ncbi:unnamed protein product [Mesocestoides corti]|uniref:PDZ domain-containing protein n=1 Tax=Mesocestoides corti TaxID=53468 RepID=A0A158QUK7_MESCO|nr:unnamed protein product [Mesocestoides corti]
MEARVVTPLVHLHTRRHTHMHGGISMRPRCSHQVNGEDVQNASHEEAMEVFQRAPDPVIVVEVMRRPQTKNATSAPPSVFPTPQVAGGGGLCGPGQGTPADSNSEISSVLSGRRGSATQSVGVQTVLSAGEMAASLAIAAASFAQQEAKMALMGDMNPYCMGVMPGKHPTDYLGISGAGDGAEDEDESEEEGDGEGVDDAVFGAEEVGCLDYILKRYPCNSNGVLPPFTQSNLLPQPIDSVYANFPDNPHSSPGNIVGGEYSSNGSDKCFEVILQKQSVTDKFGLTLCYRPSEVQQNVTEVYISEVGFLIYAGWPELVADDDSLNSPTRLFLSCLLSNQTTSTHMNHERGPMFKRLTRVETVRGVQVVAKLSLCGFSYAFMEDYLTSVYPQIEQGSVAHRSGQVMLGDRLLKIGDQEITTREHVVDLFLGCGLCAKITLLRQTPWKVLPGRLQPPYPGNPYPDSTLDIGLTNTAYAHLPEGEEHKLMNSVPVSWPLMDPNAGNLAQAAAFLASGKSHVLDEELIQLSQLMQSLALHCHNLAYVKMCGGLSAEGSLQLPKEGEEGEGVGGVVDATNSPNKTRQTPRMGLGAASSAHKSSSTSGLPPKSGRVPVDEAPTSHRLRSRRCWSCIVIRASAHVRTNTLRIIHPVGGGGGGVGWRDEEEEPRRDCSPLIAPLKLACCRRHRKCLTAADVIYNFFDTSLPAEPSCDSPAFNGGYYEAVVNPKRPGNPLTLSLSHRQTPSAHLPAPLDLDTSLPQTKCLVSIPATTSTTNPSSIWSIAETDKELPVQQSVRFSVGSPSQFMQQGSRSSHVGSTSSCERQGNSEVGYLSTQFTFNSSHLHRLSTKSNASLNDVNVSKPPIQPSVQHQQSQSAGGSLSGSKLSCVSSCSNTSNSRLTRSPVSSTAEHYCPVRGGSGPQEYAFDCLANNPAYMNPIHGAPGMFFPPSFIHPYEFYDRYFKNGLPPPPSTGMLPCFRYPSPQPQTWMYSRKSENDEDKCKASDDTASSNIYETPYAAVDVVGPPTKSPDNNSVCFTSYGLLNSASAGQGTTSVGNVSKSIEKPPQNRPLMEWVVKKRTDGTRYITRRPVRYVSQYLSFQAHQSFIYNFSGILTNLSTALNSKYSVALAPCPDYTGFQFGGDSTAHAGSTASELGRPATRNRLLKERAHKLAEERAGLTTDDDGQSDPRGRSGVSPAPVATSSRHHSKGERKRHEPGPDAYRSCSKADRGSSSYRRRTTPTRAEKQPPSTGGLVSLTTV